MRHVVITAIPNNALMVKIIDKVICNAKRATYIIFVFVVRVINYSMAPILMKHEHKSEVKCFNICEYLFPRGT